MERREVVILLARGSIPRGHLGCCALRSYHLNACGPPPGCGIMSCMDDNEIAAIETAADDMITEIMDHDLMQPDVPVEQSIEFLGLIKSNVDAQLNAMREEAR